MYDQNFSETHIYQLGHSVITKCTIYNINMAKDMGDNYTLKIFQFLEEKKCLTIAKRL